MYIKTASVVKNIPSIICIKQKKLLHENSFVGVLKDEKLPHHRKYFFVLGLFCVYFGFLGSEITLSLKTSIT